MDEVVYLTSFSYDRTAALFALMALSRSGFSADPALLPAQPHLIRFSPQNSCYNVSKQCSV